MHPILVRLTPEYAGMLGAAVALMMLVSNWAALPSDKRTGARLAIGGLIAALVGAAAGYFIGDHFFDKAHPPAIHTFGPLVALGSFLAIVYIRREGARRGFDPESLTGLAVEVLLVGGALGSMDLVFVKESGAWLVQP